MNSNVRTRSERNNRSITNDDERLQQTLFGKCIQLSRCDCKVYCKVLSHYFNHYIHDSQAIFSDETIKLTVEDLAVAGDLLGVVVAVSIIMNIYTMFVVSKNWKNFVQVHFYNQLRHNQNF
jgi:hypothetical protein